jgi:hypothetical protein
MCLDETSKRAARRALGLVLFTYVLSYLVLSRIGYAEADRMDSRGVYFYYFGFPVDERGHPFMVVPVPI